MSVNGEPNAIPPFWFEFMHYAIYILLEIVTNIVNCCKIKYFEMVCFLVHMKNALVDYKTENYHLVCSVRAKYFRFNTEILLLWAEKYN